MTSASSVTGADPRECRPHCSLALSVFAAVTFQHTYSIVNMLSYYLPIYLDALHMILSPYMLT